MFNVMGIIRFEVADSRGKGERGLMEHGVVVAGGTADIETGQRLIIKRPLCPFPFCNYKMSQYKGSPT